MFGLWFPPGFWTALSVFPVRLAGLLSHPLAFQSLDQLLDSAYSLRSLFAAKDPLPLSMLALYAFTIGSWLLTLVTANYSWVDRLWSITPVVYVGIFARESIYAAVHLSPIPSPRLLALFVIVLLWGARLTYNFYRKGGYNPATEDYRWATVHRYIPNPVLWQLFNFFFIAVYQNVLLWLVALPAYVVHVTRDQVPFQEWDAILVVVSVLVLLGETTADQQQWNFHQLKHGTSARGSRPPARRSSRKASLKNAHVSEDDLGDVERGFLTRGLFRYSRHLNYFCEMSIWVCVYGFGVLATGGVWWNVSIVGPVLYVLLFQGSIALTEWISTSKYPAYKDYQRKVSRVLPWFPPKEPIAVR